MGSPTAPGRLSAAPTPGHSGLFQLRTRLISKFGWSRREWGQEHAFLNRAPEEQVWRLVETMKGKRRTTITAQSTQTKPSVVFCHGVWADGSCFNKVIPTIQAEGHQVMTAQYGLDTLACDVATVKRTLRRVSSPAILVGHSYGGTECMKAAQYRSCLTSEEG